MNYYIQAWKKIFDFSGRARRKEYWTFVLLNLVITYGLIGLDLAMGGGGTLSMIAMVFSFIALIPNISVVIRRMHDVGKSGWFCLIPLYNLILSLTDSEAGSNKWGPNPKTGALDTEDHLIA